MSYSNKATRAYAASSGLRGIREQEADLFLRVNAALRNARDGGALAMVRALSDVGRLWNAVIDVVLDPDNALPVQLKASIVSVGRAVQREIACPQPNVEFLLTINADLAAGLSGRT
jgi:flagellar biosynthesis regulator FlaF